MHADESRGAKAAAASTSSSSSAASDEAVQLTPVEVHESTTGYYASNTMSGTRMNAKLE